MKLGTFQSNRIYIVLYHLISICLIISFAICLFVSIKDEHLYVVTFMPLAAFILFIASSTNRKVFNNLAIIIINVSMVIRFGLYPATMILDNSYGIHYADYTDSIILLIYELVGIYVVIALAGKKLLNNNYETKYSNYLGIFTFLLLLFMIPACVISPSLLRQFSISSDTVKLVDGSTAGFIVSFFSMGIWTLITYLLGSLGSITKNNNPLIRWGGLFLAFGISTMYLLSRVINGSNVKRWGIISTGIVIAVILTKTFPNKRNHIIRIAAIGIVAGVIIGSFVKFDESYSLFTFISTNGSFASLDAYFAGVKGVSDGLSAINNDPIAGTLKSTLTDLFSGVPIISRFFNANINSIPVIYLKYVRRSDLICPLIVQSVAHFGRLGAPILSMLFTYLAIVFNKRMKTTNNLYETFVCVELTFYLSLVMELNTLIVLGVFWVRLIYILILHFDRRLVISKRGL